jgi:hypothetical protein
MIIKVQRPLDDAAAPWLVYNQSRSTYELIAAPPTVVVSTVGEREKMYWHATRNVAGTLHFVRPAPDQAW